jgi:hypothetical protein
MKSKSNMNYTNSQSGYINTPLSSTSGITKIYTKKKSNTQQQQQQQQQSNQGRPIKLQSSSASRTNLNHFTNAKPPQPHQSSTRLVSNSANTPSISKKALPVGVGVSTGCSMA